MYVTMVFIFLSVMSPEDVCGRRRITDRTVAHRCHVEKCGGPFGPYETFNCRCEEESWEEADPQCIPIAWLCDGRMDCENEADEKECFCPPGQFQCGSDRGGDTQVDYRFQYNCIDNERVLNGVSWDCYSNADERNFSCIEDPQRRCNGFLDCDEPADEMYCDECPLHFPLRCACNKPDDEFSCKGSGFTCYVEEMMGDGSVHCADGSDEDGHKCKNNEFTCQCFRNSPKTCPPNTIGCIPIDWYDDKEEDCEDGSDEREYFRRTSSSGFDITVRRLDFKQQCENHSDCDESTCVIVPALHCAENMQCNATEVICTSHYERSMEKQPYNTIFQCEKGFLDITHNFCNEKVDCPDGSDEIIDGPGFKCSSSFGRCVLPQRNLYDGIAQCSDGSDLCLGDSCFECLDGKLIISQTQLCDGVIDCFDLSDECLCQINFNKPICEKLFILNDPNKLECGKTNSPFFNKGTTSIATAKLNNSATFNRSRNEILFTPMPSHIRCQTKYGEITAVTCDGRPECKNFKDECSCDDRPSFCSDGCHDYYPLGDLYCDGIKDDVWNFTYNASCPKGFDEASCPQRFTCQAGNLVSIDRDLVCDGIDNCDDGADEKSCMESFEGTTESIFSSNTEMIESVALRCVFWIMAVLVIIGNSCVMFSTACLLYKKKISESRKLNHFLILNLSLSDLLMGVYLLLISIKSLQYSGYYGEFDFEWRTSLECSIVGSLAVISSETSCFIMTILTAFRLYNIFRPFAARTASTLKWKLGIVLAWSVSLVLALIPLSKQTSDYFVDEIWFSNLFTSSEVWNKTEVMTFACRLASLSNHSIEINGSPWESFQIFFNKHFPDYSLKGEFGYYGETSVCMPRIYLNKGDHAWLYSLLIITLNFIAFLFVAISYAFVCFKACDRPLERNKLDEQSHQMQKRIARLIATDFACWIPICFMVYLKTGGVNIHDVVYIVTAGVLLPINSALNPLLYSTMIKKHFQQTFFCTKRQVSRDIVLRSRSNFAGSKQTLVLSPSQSNMKPLP